MRGRKPVPTALKEVRNNPGRRPLNPREPKLPVVCPPPPDYLSAEAKSRWLVISEQLQKAGLLTAIDTSSLASYCTVWVRWQRSEAAITLLGDIIQTPNGLVQQSPHVGMANTALRHVSRYEVEFGMTPSSRSRVTAQPQDAAPAPASFEARIPKIRRVK